MKDDNAREMVPEDSDESVAETVLQTAQDDGVRTQLVMNQGAEMCKKALKNLRTDAARASFLADSDAEIRKLALSSITSIPVLNYAPQGVDRTGRRQVRASYMCWNMPQYSRKAVVVHYGLSDSPVRWFLSAFLHISAP